LLRRSTFNIRYSTFDIRHSTFDIQMTEITSQLSTALADRYKIESHLGEGGMATVYLAHDVKHDRKVALKVLRPELAAVIGAERFLQEIKVTANLQHPHILPLHDSGEASSFLYYVMPYVEGDTLRDKLDRERQLAIEDAIEITCSIASALDYAHRQGVIHRDIKPENILLHDGQAMVADFGIALAVSEASGKRLTETGLSIGTPHYMSPEQAMGDRELDARSDVYSLAAMLYEMLAGEPPYQGSTAQAIVAKVITEKAPPVTAARDTVPGHVNSAIVKALNKMPADRFSTAAAFANALTNTAFTTPATAIDQVTTVAAGPTRRAVPLWMFTATAVIAVVTTALAVFGTGGTQVDPAVAKFDVQAIAGNPPGTQWGRVDVSPDGSMIAYLWNIEGTTATQIVLRRLDQLEGTVVPRTEDARNPTFSPDGEWVAFFAGGSIKKIRLAGGPPLGLADGVMPRGLSWGNDRTIVFTGQTGLLRMPEAGGVADTLTVAELGRAHNWPDQLPNGKGVVFTDFSGNENARVAVVDLESGSVTELVEGLHARYVSTGHLVYGSPDGSLLAIPFDQDRLIVTGAAVPLLEGVSLSGSGSTRFAVSANGTLVYQTGSGGGRMLVRVDRDGVETALSNDTRTFNEPRYSPDGSRIAVSIQDDQEDIWIYDVVGNTSTRLTVEGDNRAPTWTPDGRFVTFGSRGRDSVQGVFWRAVDGSTPAEMLVATPGSDYPYPGTWTPDGRQLVYRVIEASRNLWALTMDGDTLSEHYLATDFQEEGPVLSPAGRWVAYTSNETGQREVYVRAFPESSGRIPVSTDGGNEPLWSRDGTELFYRAAGRLVAATVELTPSFRVVSRQDLFDVSQYQARTLMAGYDVHADGSFLMLKIQGGSSEMIVVLNWFEELKEAVR
jgi:serine/threonine-protein kinase